MFLPLELVYTHIDHFTGQPIDMSLVSVLMNHLKVNIN